MRDIRHLCVAPKSWTNGAIIDEPAPSGTNFNLASGIAQQLLLWSDDLGLIV
jgi:hypothetical protein